MFLGGNAWRTPASGGGASQGPVCFSFSCLGVCFVKYEGLSSNLRFLRARVVKGLSVICNRHVVI
jgi:hypothetical protein